MRSEPTPEETWTIKTLLEQPFVLEERWVQDEEFTDAPDLVLEGPIGRVACEITTVGLNEMHRWSRDPRMQLNLDELDEIEIAREADIWISNIISEKNPKVNGYLNNADADQAWLLVHGGLLYDFFALDSDDYDVPLMQKAASEVAHDFDRIYVFSSRSKIRNCVNVFPLTSENLEPPDLTQQKNLLGLTIKSMRVQTNRGITNVNLGKEPDRKITVPPLRRYI